MSHKELMVTLAVDAAIKYEEAKQAGASREELTRLEADVACYTARARQYGVGPEEIIAAAEQRLANR